MSSDRNLLFGILALQMDFVSRDQLVAAMNAWVLEKKETLGQVLHRQGALATDERALLEALVQKHLERHDNDAEKSLAAVRHIGLVRDDLQRIADQDVQASLGHVTALQKEIDPDATRALSVGTLTSTGVRFRVVRSHARGGLGEVFVAQDEELKREVALKHILASRADDPDTRSRFLLEAEVTGGLEHPCIVPVYGLGKYADGRPYYAMRFIRGDSLKDAIKRFHREARPQPDAVEHGTLGAEGQSRLRDGIPVTLRQLLRRFIDVCNAIEYAHDRHVLHRDLKPGNIMLGKYGETFVVDWGLAKPGDLPDRTAPTQETALHPYSLSGASKTLQGSVVGTPAYMSPEQADGRNDQLGASSDVYSLGATLYYLLTGKDPIEDVSVTEIMRRTRSGDFPKPRQRERGIPVPLEAICLKAMALEPRNRYASARALSDDIEHWLADEPVSVHRESLGERVARWARRHRNWVTAGMASITVITVLSIVAAILINGARRRETLAKIEAEQNYLLARGAVDELLTQVSESKLLNVEGLQPLREDLLKSARGYYQKFAKQRADNPTLRMEVAEADYRIGIIAEKIGPRKEAIEALQRAQSIQEQLVQENFVQPQLRFDLANTHNALGDIEQETGNYSAALTRFESARKLRAALVDEQPVDDQYRRKLANSCQNIAIVLSKLGKPAQAKSEFERAGEIRADLVKAHSDDPQFGSDLARGYYNFGLHQRDNGDASGALASLQRAAEKYQELAKSHPKVIDYGRELAISEREIGDLQAELEHYEAATESYKTALAIAQPLVKKNPLLVQLRADVAAIYTNMGRLNQQTAALPEAVQRFEQAQAIQKQLVDFDPASTQFQTDLAATDLQIGKVQLATGELSPAKESFDAGLKLYQALAADRADDRAIQDAIAQAYADMGLVERRQDAHEAALPWFQKAQDVYEKLNGLSAGADADVGLADALLNIAVEQRSLARPEEALVTLKRAAQVQAKLIEHDPAKASYRHTLAEIDHLAGLIHAQSSNLAEALKCYQRVQAERTRLVAEHPENLEYVSGLGVTLDELAVVLWQRGEKEQSLDLSRQAADYLRKARERLPTVAQYRISLAANCRNRAYLERESGHLNESVAASLERKNISAHDPQELYGVATELAAASAVELKSPQGQKEQSDQWLDQAMETLQEAVHAGFDDFEQINRDPQLELLRQHPRFRELEKPAK